jgi:hypothetical protein
MSSRPSPRRSQQNARRRRLELFLDDSSGTLELPIRKNITDTLARPNARHHPACAAGIGAGSFHDSDRIPLYDV